MWQLVQLSEAPPFGLWQRTQLRCVGRMTSEVSALADAAWHSAQAIAPWAAWLNEAPGSHRSGVTGGVTCGTEFSRHATSWQRAQPVNLARARRAHASQSPRP